MSRLTRDGTAGTVSSHQILRRERGQGTFYLPCSAYHEQDWQPYPSDPYSCYIRDHNYIHNMNKYCATCFIRPLTPSASDRWDCLTSEIVFTSSRISYRVHSSPVCLHVWSWGPLPFPKSYTQGAVRRGRGGKEKEWTDCVQSDIRAFGMTGDWETMAVKAEIWVEAVTKGGRRFMAAWRQEEEDAARHRQEKREATRLGKLQSHTEA